MVGAGLWAELLLGRRRPGHLSFCGAVPAAAALAAAIAAVAITVSAAYAAAVTAATTTGVAATTTEHSATAVSAAAALAAALAAAATLATAPAFAAAALASVASIASRVPGPDVCCRRYRSVAVQHQPHVRRLQERELVHRPARVHVRIWLEEHIWQLLRLGSGRPACGGRMLRLRTGVQSSESALAQPAVALAAASVAQPAATQPAATQPSVAEPTAAVAVITTTLAQPDAS